MCSFHLTALLKTLMSLSDVLTCLIRFLVSITAKFKLRHKISQKTYNLKSYKLKQPKTMDTFQVHTLFKALNLN